MDWTIHPGIIKTLPAPMRSLLTPSACPPSKKKFPDQIRLQPLQCSWHRIPFKCQVITRAQNIPEQHDAHQPRSLWVTLQTNPGKQSRAGPAGPPPTGRRQGSACCSEGSPVPTWGSRALHPATCARNQLAPGALGSVALASSSKDHLLNLCEEPHARLYYVAAASHDDKDSRRF